MPYQWNYIEVRLNKVAVRKVCIDKACIGEVGIPKITVFKIGLGKIALREIGMVQRQILKGFPGKISACFVEDRQGRGIINSSLVLLGEKNSSERF